MTFYWLSRKEFHKKKTASNISLSVAQSSNCYNVLVNISKSTKVICFVFPVLDNLWVLYTHMHSDKLMLVYWFILACVLKTWLHLFGNITLPWPAAEINTKLQAALLRLGQNISSFLIPVSIKLTGNCVTIKENFQPTGRGVYLAITSVFMETLLDLWILPVLL